MLTVLTILNKFTVSYGDTYVRMTMYYSNTLVNLECLKNLEKIFR